MPAGEVVQSHFSSAQKRIFNLIEQGRSAMNFFKWRRRPDIPILKQAQAEYAKLQ